MKYQTYLPLNFLAKDKNRQFISERKFSTEAKISRSCLRNLQQGNYNARVSSICAIAEFLAKEVEIIIAPKTSQSEFSTVAISYKVMIDGFDSWKIHFIDFIDEFRRSQDPRLILLPPPRKLDESLVAMLASIVCFLCEEMNMATPAWASKRYFLDSPWFVSGIESLKASAIQESPLAFRNNNIFVMNNFASRA